MAATAAQPKRPRGRPPLPKEQRKKHWLHADVPLDAAEERDVRAVCVLLGLSLAEFGRTAMVAEARTILRQRQLGNL